MKNVDVIRAWKDEEYRLSLSKADRALLPEHPAGGIELTDAELGSASGGAFRSLGCPGSWICPIPTVTVCPSCLPFPPWCW